MGTEPNISEVSDIPDDVRDDHEHEPVYCVDCEQVVRLTMNVDDAQPVRHECGCTSIAPGVMRPDHWRWPYR